MDNFLKLKKEVSETTADIDGDDVLSVKKNLENLGYYKKPEWGMTKFGDNQMFDGIRTFQKEKQLKVDGIMKPAGETERKINEMLQQKNQPQENKSMVADKDKKIRDRMYPVIKGYEKEIDFPYKDSKGYITVGVGSNIDNRQQFEAVKWVDEKGSAVSKEAVRHHYQKLKDFTGKNYVADYFKEFTPLRLPEVERIRLFEEHMKQDLQDLRKTFENFDEFPMEMQDVLLDIKYNTGNVEKTKWPNLHKAISERNLKNIIANVHRKDIDEKRNQWAIEHLQKIKSLKY